MCITILFDQLTFISCFEKMKYQEACVCPQNKTRQANLLLEKMLVLIFLDLTFSVLFRNTQGAIFVRSKIY